jgi:hypothetical protein
MYGAATLHEAEQAFKAFAATREALPVKPSVAPPPQTSAPPSKESAPRSGGFSTIIEAAISKQKRIQPLFDGR